MINNCGSIEFITPPSHASVSRLANPLASLRGMEPEELLAKSDTARASAPAKQSALTRSSGLA
jgi:hypothetical protein